jgi:hypothetical protein
VLSPSPNVSPKKTVPQDAEDIASILPSKAVNTIFFFTAYIAALLLKIKSNWQKLIMKSL